MSGDWYPAIRAFCIHWTDAPMLQETFATLEQEFADDHDASIDAAKSLVECACRVIIDELDDPLAPIKPEAADTPVHALVGAAIRLLKLGDVRHRKFADLIRHHNSLTSSLRELLRNEAGPVSHGKDGFIRTLSERHRRAAVLSADAIVGLLHSAYLELVPDPVRTREPYERFYETNKKIDEYCSVVASTDEGNALSVDVRLPDGDEISLRVEISRLLFEVDREAYKQAALTASSINPIETEEEEAT
jgi:Abortive infection C-terminus